MAQIKEAVSGLVTKVKNGAIHIKTYWSKPPEGKYVSYKEITAYSVGGVGVNFIAAMVGQLSLSINTLLIASVYGISPVWIGFLNTIATAITLLITPIRGAFMDNAKNRKRGKYRPFILYFGLPIAILCSAMPFIPTDLGEELKIALVGVGCVVLAVMNAQFFVLGYNNLAQVMTPNSDERTNIYTVATIIYSFAPTVTGFVMPLISNSFGGLTSITTYRVMIPIFSIVGLLISFLAYFGTKERIVVAKDYVAKVKFFEGFKKIAGNKYFWLINIGAWISFSRAASGSILTWLYIYHIQNNVIMSFVGLVIGTASLVGMLLTPVLTKKFGKRNVVIYSNIVHIVFTSLIALFPNSAVFVFIFTYFANAAGATSMITSPAMNADVLDYQQWKTGDRLEGFSGNFGIIGSLLGLGTSLVVPYVIQLMGIINNYDLLYDNAVRVPIFRTLALLSAGGALLGTIPYLFYDLTEAKHKQIIEDLKQRALDPNAEIGMETTQEELERDIQGE